MTASEPFVCDECGQQGWRYNDSNACIGCEAEYRAGVALAHELAGYPADLKEEIYLAEEMAAYNRGE